MLMGPGRPRISVGWDSEFPGQLSSSYMVLVPLILKQIKQSSQINGFPPCLLEQIIKHSMHLSLLPSHPFCFPVRDICCTRPCLQPTFHPLPCTAGVAVCLISLIQMSVKKFLYSLTHTSWYLPLT